MLIDVLQSLAVDGWQIFLIGEAAVVNFVVLVHNTDFGQRFCVMKKVFITDFHLLSLFLIMKIQDESYFSEVGVVLPDEVCP